MGEKRIHPFPVKCHFYGSRKQQTEPRASASGYLTVHPSANASKDLEFTIQKPDGSRIQPIRLLTRAAPFFRQPPSCEFFHSFFACRGTCLWLGAGRLRFVPAIVHLEGFALS
jgi:hypothetical protein